MTAPTRRSRGFTLLEVMGVILVTALVLGVATDYYIDLSRATTRASTHTRDIRRATALLDRVARDFESTVLLVKPPDVDPLEHPWLFVAEAREGLAGADHIKFISRGFPPRRSDAPESDLMLVAYTLNPGLDGDTLDLYRWTSPQLGDSLDRSFPAEDDEANVLMAEGLVEFGVTFTSETETGLETWDSTTLLQSSDLPTALEITVAFAPPEGEFDPDEVPRFHKSVLLPLRPLDLAALIDPNAAEDGAGAAEEDEDPDADDEEETAGEPTLGECFNLAAVDPETADEYASLIDFAQANQNRPWSHVRGMVPSRLLKFVQADPDCQ